MVLNPCAIQCMIGLIDHCSIDLITEAVSTNSNVFFYSAKSSTTCTGMFTLEAGCCCCSPLETYGRIGVFQFSVLCRTANSITGGCSAFFISFWYSEHYDLILESKGCHNIFYNVF